jgi:type I restriction enzyme S subunit
MSGWPVVALGDIFDIARGGSPRPIDDYVTEEPDGINWITISDASEGSKYITRTKRRIRAEGTKRSRMVHPGDFLLTNSMSFGRPYILRTSGCIHDGWLVLSQKSDVVDQDFFFHLLESKAVYAEFARLAAGATVKNLNIESVRGVRVPLPPLPEQRQIAEVLDRAEALRAKRRAALAQLDTLTQALFLDAFGDPLKNPKGTETAPLASMCTRITDGTHQPPTWSDIGHPFLFVSNIVTGEISFETQKFISNETHAELTRRCPIEIGDVLYSTVGSYGVPALVRTSRKFAFQRHIAHLKPDPRVLDSEFLRAMLASQPLLQQADRAARGVAQKTVNLADIRNFVVFRPPLALQRDFARRVAAVEKLKTAYRASLAGLGTLFASLQHRAFRGEL